MSAESSALVCPGCKQPTDPSVAQCEQCRYLHLGRLVPSLSPPAETEQPEGAAEPGWYKDPAGDGQRYWDGRQWKRRWLGQGTAGTSPENDGLATIGWVTAILIPIVGLVVGIVLSSRNDRRGTPIAIAAVGIFMAWIIFWVILNAIAVSSVGTGY